MRVRSFEQRLVIHILFTGQSLADSSGNGNNVSAVGSIGFGGDLCSFGTLPADSNSDGVVDFFDDEFEAMS